MALRETNPPPSPEDDAVLALSALAWTLDDPARAARLLALTGLDPAALRARAGEPAVLAATIGFLAAYEPDLLACATALAVDPARLASLQRGLMP
jgi:hypothetical protein